MQVFFASISQMEDMTDVTAQLTTEGNKKIWGKTGESIFLRLSMDALCHSRQHFSGSR